MSAVRNISVAPPSLADELDLALAHAFAGSASRCLWCGSGEVVAESINSWTGAVFVRCGACGSRLVGIAPRRRREVRS